ncbi:MAG: hypothetical protein MUF14_05880 [Hyphomonadaceae bacterium]|nr:hypothetical protein [Hyphomonadaceae bacterium]
MHDIKTLRADPAHYDAAWVRKGLDPQTPAIIALDEQVRAAKSRRMEAEATRNSASKAIGAAKAKKDEAEAARLMEQVAAAKAAMEAAASEEAVAEPQLHALLAALPNLPDPSVPDGTDEHGNVEAARWGSPRQFNYAPKDHVAIGEALGLMDFAAAARMSGARFVVLKGQLARLERALGQFMLDTQTGERGYQEVNPPLMVRNEAMFGTGQLPKFEDDLFDNIEAVSLPNEDDEATSLENFKNKQVSGSVFLDYCDTHEIQISKKRYREELADLRGWVFKGDKSNIFVSLACLKADKKNCVTLFISRIGLFMLTYYQLWLSQIVLIHVKN